MQNLKSYLLIIPSLVFIILAIGCKTDNKDLIKKTIGNEEYNRLMKLSQNDFDQSSIGFRQYSDDYEMVTTIIPEYIKVNELSDMESRNLNWHLGQVHAFNDNYKDAILTMNQSYAGGSKTWECYVSGTIAFLEKDKDSLLEALEMLRQQENQMNIEFLEKFIKYFDLPYFEAYNADF